MWALMQEEVDIRGSSGDDKQKERFYVALVVKLYNKNNVILVAEEEGLKFDKKEIFNRVSKGLKDSGDNTSSMLQDILKGRKTEIDFLNGKIVELGKKYKVNTPVNEVLVSMVKFLENK